jgi:hypothetical protein
MAAPGATDAANEMPSQGHEPPPRNSSMLCMPSISDVQARTGQSRQFKYANETPRQQALHREIELEAKRKQPQPRSIKMSNLRKKEMHMLFAKRYPIGQLPDDDAGRDDARLMVDHLMLRGEDHARRWAALDASWMPEDELAGMIEDAGLGKWWGPMELGQAMRLTHAERKLLDIRTFRPIDRTMRQLKQDNRERRIQAARNSRIQAGATPRAMSAERLQPWKIEGISRAKWYRRKRNQFQN